MEFLVIGAGAFLGANARYLIAVWTVERFGGSFPVGTLLVNVTGSFVIGLFLAALGERAVTAAHLRLFFVTGFLGAYTTFSTFSYEALALAQQQNWPGAAVYVGGSVALSLMGVVAGVAVGRALSGV